ncbi:MAG: tetratricopeptide repeat protein [Acidobacteria bacterium]|nr:tetratricopeptide repeat protein [Acidobacteriota bacterium]
MPRPLTTIVLLSCFFSLIIGARSSIFAQPSPQADEKERGIELYRKGNFSEAVKTLKEAVKKQQSDSDAWYYLGLSLHLAGNVKDARKAFEKTLSLSPDFAPAYTAMAYMQLLGNDNQGAVKNAEKAFALDPKNIESLFISGLARLRQGAAAEAIVRAEEALKIKPDYPQALILKTQALINMFSQERAKQVGGAETREEGASSGDAGGAAKVRPRYYLLKAASESLEAYLKLNPEQSERALWSEQLETLRFYARNLDNSDPDDSVTGMTATLRPTILYREKALYTEAARDAGVEGIVLLKVVFGADGVMKHILAIRSLSHGLTEQAILAARKIRFTPAMRDGKPISVIGNLEFMFKLY